MRSFVQANQSPDLLCSRGIGIEVLARHIGKTEFGLGRKLPSQVELNALADGGGVGQQLGRGRFVKFQKHVGTFDLDPLAAVQFYLYRSFSL